MDHVVEMRRMHRGVVFALVLYPWQKCVTVLRQVKSLVWILCVQQNRYITILAFMPNQPEAYHLSDMLLA